MCRNDAAARETGGAGRQRVPYTLADLVIGATCIAASWKLGKSDVCFNMMPL